MEFTLNWEEDALRRDFTINAIYADINGRIFDPQNGVSDLNKGKLKFVGSPSERIQEDYLRILRYLRFFTQYSRFDHDKEVIQFIKQYINGLNTISKERIFDEIKKILSLKNIYNLFLNDQSKEIILNIFPQFKFYQRLKNFNNLGKKLKDKYDYKMILALLIVDHTDNCDFFCYKYKTSNDIINKFHNITKNIKNFKSKKFYLEENLKKLIYFTSKENVSDVLLFSKCENNKIKDTDLEKLLNYVDSCKIPKFPISGDDLKREGYTSGQILGKKLKFLEEKWIENNFVLDKNYLKNL